MIFQVSFQYRSTVQVPRWTQLSGGTRHLFARYLCFQSCGTTGKKQKLLGSWFNRRDLFLSPKVGGHEESPSQKGHEELPVYASLVILFGNRDFFWLRNWKKPVVSKVKGAGFLVGFGGEGWTKAWNFLFFLRKETINSAWWMNDEWILVERKC